MKRVCSLSLKGIGSGRRDRCPPLRLRLAVASRFATTQTLRRGSLYRLRLAVASRFATTRATILAA